MKQTITKERRNGMQDRFRVRGWSVFDSGYYDDIQNMLFGEENNMTLLDAISKGLVNEIIPEQCTGLKDKNGKLIYEGDILATSPNSQSYGCYKVFFQKDECSFKVISCDGSHDYAIPLNVLTEKNDFQIIGNIHENPELLK